MAGLTFEQALRAHLVMLPRAGKLGTMLRSIRGRRMLQILDMPDCTYRRRHLARWEAAVCQKYRIDPSAPIDWGTVLDWAKLFFQILGIIFTLLLLFADKPKRSKP
jgi:hypothetical protein